MTTFRKIPPICPLSNLDMNFDNLVSLRVAILYVLVLTICNLHFWTVKTLKNLTGKWDLQMLSRFSCLPISWESIVKISMQEFSKRFYYIQISVFIIMKLLT